MLITCIIRTDFHFPGKKPLYIYKQLQTFRRYINTMELKFKKQIPLERCIFVFLKNKICLNIDLHIDA